MQISTNKNLKINYRKKKREILLQVENGKGRKFYRWFLNTFIEHRWIDSSNCNINHNDNKDIHNNSNSTNDSKKKNWNPLLVWHPCHMTQGTRGTLLFHYSGQFSAYNWNSHACIMISDYDCCGWLDVIMAERVGTCIDCTRLYITYCIWKFICICVRVCM